MKLFKMLSINVRRERQSININQSINILFQVNQQQYDNINREISDNYKIRNRSETCLNKK